MRIYDRGCCGVIENVTVDNVYASKSDRALVKFPAVFGYRQYGIIDIEPNLKIKNLTVTNLYRRELVDGSAPTINAFRGSEIDVLTLRNITAENLTDADKMPFFKVRAVVKHCHCEALYNDGEPVDFVPAVAVKETSK